MMRASEALDAVIRRERAWLDLNALRLYTHPGFRLVFTEFLVRVYHGMHTATALMEAARIRSAVLATACPVAARLVPYWDKHIREEAGHDEWLLDDMRGLGMDVDGLLGVPPTPDVAELMGTLHFWVLHTHPVTRTVEEGDFEGYSRLYHPDAVLVSSGSGASHPISQALVGWEKDFDATRQGKARSSVTFRFTQRLHDETTAHESGMFRYTAKLEDGSETVGTVHFEGLLVRKDGVWLMVMEYQKQPATDEEWEMVN